jgi:NADPH:quinone reductase-like Zn-dependent oxidoreductase
MLMKAIVYDEYGSPDVAQLRDVEMPVVGDDDVLVRIRAASVNPLDWHFLNGTPYLLRMQAGMRAPKNTRLGVDLAGEVEAVGRNVTEFQPGDEVFGGSTGSFAEYVCAKEKEIALKPSNMSFEQAASVAIAAMTALQALRDSGSLEAGQTVLFNGASGGVGTFAVQIAKALGAEVTGVCSTRNVAMVESIGADHVIDYSKEDFTKGSHRYDLILDTVGNHGQASLRRVLEPEGIFVSVGSVDMGDWIGPLTDLGKLALGSMFRSQKMKSMLAKRKKEDLLTVKELLESGKVTPVIDQRFALADVPEALRYQGEGHARGKTVITI